MLIEGRWKKQKMRGSIAGGRNACVNLRFPPQIRSAVVCGNNWSREEKKKLRPTSSCFQALGQMPHGRDLGCEALPKEWRVHRHILGCATPRHSEFRHAMWDANVSFMHDLCVETLLCRISH